MHLNFAENLLKTSRRCCRSLFSWRGTAGPPAPHICRTPCACGGTGKGIAGLRSSARRPRCGFMPNIPETVVAMLATTAIGAVWSSCSPDFGAQGVLDRFGQIEPQVLFAVDGYFYSGKTRLTGQAHRDCRGIAQPAEGRCRALCERCPDLSGISRAVLLDDFVAQPAGGEIEFDAAAVLITRCTSCILGHHRRTRRIVHGAGGTLLQHLKEHQHVHWTSIPVMSFLLHDLRLDDVELAGLGTGQGRRWPCTTAHRSFPMAMRSSTYETRSASRCSGLRQSICDALRKSQLRPGETHRLARAEDHPVDRLAARSGRLRLRLPQDQARCLSVVDLRRHRHHLVFCTGQRGAAGLAWRTAVP